MKIMQMKEEKSLKEVEECVFTPQILTRRQGESVQRRNLEKFLEDQKKFEEMKNQKIVERREEQHVSSLSQTLRGPYVNSKSRKILEEKAKRDESIQRFGDKTSP